MPDVYTVHLQNFRSIRDARVNLAPLTVIYGQNGSGKSLADLWVANLKKVSQ